jgi:hypothetical protein
VAASLFDPMYDEQHRDQHPGIDQGLAGQRRVESQWRVDPTAYALQPPLLRPPCELFGSRAPISAQNPNGIADRDRPFCGPGEAQETGPSGTRRGFLQSSKSPRGSWDWRMMDRSVPILISPC